MSLFKSLDELPCDPILGITENYLNDPREKKVNLGVGVYRDQKGRLTLMSAVSQAEALIFKEPKAKNYLPISGNKNYLSCLESLIFGNELPLFKER
jgi:aromatic-amino-acid transaminase